MKSWHLAVTQFSVFPSSNNKICFCKRQDPHIKSLEKHQLLFQQHKKGL